jgi:hypothetical protein
MVYLLHRGMETTRPSNKLDYKKLRPFRIKKKISTSNYKLLLLEEIHAHPIFHISLLKPAPKDTIVITPRLKIKVHEEEYEVEAILNKKRINGEIKYLVKWKGYNEENNQWEPTRHLKGAQRLLQQFHQELQRRQAELNL